MLYECAMNNRRQLVSREELLFYHTLVTTKIYFLLYFLHFLLTSGERLQLTQMTVCVRMFGWNKNMISFLLHLVLMSQFHVHRTLCFPPIFQNETVKFRMKYVFINFYILIQLIRI